MKYRTILDLDHKEACEYFLKEKQYCNIDLPNYFTFQKLLNTIDKRIKSSKLSDFYKSKPESYNDVNYKILTNKDGKYAFRPLQLIHPAIYVALVYKLTEQKNWDSVKEKFKSFQSNKNINCCSMPLVLDTNTDKKDNILNWWHTVEQESIKLALHFEYFICTDITDCYGSIYTHSIPWALHTKTIAKRERKNKLLGNQIDDFLQSMSYGQTNGIPQGSTLMDFIAEIVLGYADNLLTDKIEKGNIKNDEYKILRYRDDYRIFVNNPQKAELIVKLLSEVLIELGMKLNSQKTFLSNNVITDSIKKDKLYWIANKQGDNNLQKHLFIIHNLSIKYPNSGSLMKSLLVFYKKIEKNTKTKEDIEVLISILVDMGYRNPKIYPIFTAVLSKLLTLIEDDTKKEKILNSIMKRTEKVPNVGFLSIWMQRLTLKTSYPQQYIEPICKKIQDRTVLLWNSDWLRTSLKDIVVKTPIVDDDIINKMPEIVMKEEVDAFVNKSYF